MLPVGPPQMRRLAAGDCVAVKHLRLAMHIVSRKAGMTMPAAEGGFDDHPVSLLHLVPGRSLGPDLLDPPDAFVPQDQRVFDCEGGGFALEHPWIGPAD